MSVLACARNGCENIMCDRLSHTYGYICNRCFDELLSRGPEASIGKFMAGDPPASESQRQQAEARFNVEFPLQGDIVTEEL